MTSNKKDDPSMDRWVRIDQNLRTPIRTPVRTQKAPEITYPHNKIIILLYFLISCNILKFMLTLKHVIKMNAQSFIIRNNMDVT